MSACSPHPTPRLPHTLQSESQALPDNNPIIHKFFSVKHVIIVMIFQSSFVYVFDGLPRFLSNGVVHSDHNLIGAFCGTTRAQPITVEATSGNIVHIYLVKCVT